MTGALVRWCCVYVLRDGRCEVSPTLHRTRRDAIEQAAALAAETSGPEIHVVLVEVPTSGEPVDGIVNERSAPAETLLPLLSGVEE